MSNIEKYPKCHMRTSLGNCDPIGGFCTSVNTTICEALHKPNYSYEADMVRRLKEAQSAEAVQGDLISRQALCEYALNQKDKTVTPNDIMRFPSAELTTNLQSSCNQLATDIISREDTINLFMKRADELKGIMGDLGGACSGAARLVERLPSAEPKTGWIPVGERLPENSRCVLISIAGDIEFGAYDRQNSDWAIWRDGYWDEGKRVDAWMPLPKPYREDGE